MYLSVGWPQTIPEPMIFLYIYLYSYSSLWGKKYVCSIMVWCAFGGNRLVVNHETPKEWKWKEKMMKKKLKNGRGVVQLGRFHNASGMHVRILQHWNDCDARTHASARKKRAEPASPPKIIWKTRNVPKFRFSFLVGYSSFQKKKDA